ncbi:wax ester/triacylglycerol synthase family O-acyltransferase [Streptomyces sp. HNM0663]|uniref:Diacylglycerol O-acyltransferase n=1 Tax=Streptomyces chengmaiensis TaxID=3040919 RepID=A0ABT6HGW3_9ACTN|nr:wax ester/triacylglycerol synthase family O-acyltransferase [Streptomyces chengmaiensis]MDH2388001.1 wax ester/triacylglycerol synthase family O-acyltransferase [Streptomyces chengmaiensis]
MSSELLAPVDLAFWHLETPAHPMHLGALAFFGPGPVPGQGERSGQSEPILGLLAERVAAIPRLRMRVRDVLLPVGGAAWTAAEDFDVRRHVRRLTLPGGDFERRAVAAAGELMERPLARGLPPWEMYLLTGASEQDGGADGGTLRFAVLVKLHHALADGMRAVAIGAGIFDEIADLRGAAQPPRGPARTVLPRPWLAGPREAAGLARGRIEELGRAVGVGASVVRASRLDPGAHPALTAVASGRRRLGTAVLGLDEVRRVRRAVGGTANDVLLATVAGALRRWMRERGEEPPAADPRALVPVSRRRPGSPSGTGNLLSGYLLTLPVGEDDPRARLRAVREAMDRNKAAGPLRGAGALAVLADQLPPIAHRFAAPLAGSAARLLFDLLVTNVPLPRSALRLGGCPLRALFPLAPLPRGQSLAVALTPYADRAHVGLVADARAVPDLDRLAHALHEELSALAAAVD